MYVLSFCLFDLCYVYLLITSLLYVCCCASVFVFLSTAPRRAVPRSLIDRSCTCTCTCTHNMCIYLVVLGNVQAVSLWFPSIITGGAVAARKPRTETIRKPRCSARCKMFGMLARGSLSVRIQSAREHPWFPRPRSFSGTRRLCWPTETIRKPRTETIRKRFLRRRKP